MEQVSVQSEKFWHKFNRWLWFWPEIIMVLAALPMGVISGLGQLEMAEITLLLLCQNASFTIVSRARQSANLKFHAIAAIGSNGFYIFVLTAVVAHYDNIWLKVWYIVCTVVGSVHAHHISLSRIEQSKHFKKDSLISRSDLDAAMENVLIKVRSELVPK